MVRRADWHTALAGVELQNPPILINPDGKFMLNNLDAGTRGLHFMRYGFMDTTLTVTITKDDTLDLIVDMTREIPLSGRAFFWPYYATLSMDMIPHPQSACLNFENRMFLSSQALVYLNYTSSYQHRISLTLAKPVTTGIINLADNQDNYCEFWKRQTYYIGDSLYVEDSNYSTLHPGGTGMVEIMSVNQTEHIIEGTYWDIYLTDGGTLNWQLYDGDFIGHW